MDWAYVNPFTGYLHFHQLKIYENKSDSVFFSADGVSAHFGLRQMLSSDFVITELTLKRPRGIVIQDKKDLNFADIIQRFSKKDTTDKTEKKPVHFSIERIKIIDRIIAICGMGLCTMRVSNKLLQTIPRD